MVTKCWRLGRQYHGLTELVLIAWVVVFISEGKDRGSGDTSVVVVVVVVVVSGGGYCGSSADIFGGDSDDLDGGGADMVTGDSNLVQQFL